MESEESRGRSDGRTIRFAICYLLFTLLVLPLAGCAGYHLGPVNPAVHAGDKSVEVVPFNNQTLEPRLGDAVTRALRKRFQSDATYRLATRSPGDVVVTGVITTYARRPVSFLSTDVTTPQNYRIELVAHVTARDRVSGELLLDKDVTGYSLTQTGTALAEAERQSLPLLAEDLARNVVADLTEGKW